VAIVLVYSSVSYTSLKVLSRLELALLLLYLAYNLLPTVVAQLYISPRHPGAPVASIHDSGEERNRGANGDDDDGQHGRDAKV
jgi:hypothetical protein